MRVKPAAGLKIRNPATGRHLPPEGLEVDDSVYWRRRLAEGDVVRVEVPPARRRPELVKE
jgi:hypothetical protein